jgi:3-oxoacyl-[acyl-carrier-protein] synthase-1
MSAPVIVGVGARTPVGLRADTTAAAVRAGISRVGEHPYMVDRVGEPMYFAFDRALGPDPTGRERLLGLARPALLEACAGLDRSESPRVDLLLGLPEPRPGFTEDDAAYVAGELARDLPVAFSGVTLFPSGHAAALLALQSALERLTSRYSDWCLVGGIDSYLEPDTLDWLDDNRQLKSKRNRSAFHPGEGAGFVLVTRPELAESLGMMARAQVLAVAQAREPHPIKTDGVCVGLGLCEAIREATRPIDPRRERISRSYCDINGERYRTDEFFYVPLRVWEPFVDSNTYEAPAVSWGDAGAASGALFAVLATESAARGYAPGTYSLLWASSEGGDRCAALLALPAGRRA